MSATRRSLTMRILLPSPSSSSQEATAAPFKNGHVVAVAVAFLQHPSVHGRDVRLEHHDRCTGPRKRCRSARTYHALSAAVRPTMVFPARMLSGIARMIVMNATQTIETRLIGDPKR